jgi:hypothetical protein
MLEYNRDAEKCRCRAWAYSPEMRRPDPERHHPRCPMGHSSSCNCDPCMGLRGAQEGLLGFKLIRDPAETR